MVSLGVLKLPLQTSRETSPSHDQTERQLKEDTEKCLHSCRLMNRHSQDERTTKIEQQMQKHCESTRQMITSSISSGNLKQLVITESRFPKQPHIASRAIFEPSMSQKNFKRKQKIDIADNLVSTEEDEMQYSPGSPKKRQGQCAQPKPIKINVGYGDEEPLRPVRNRETQELPGTLLDLPQYFDVREDH